MTMIEAVKSVYSKYAVFSGRSMRSEYWWFALFNIIVSIIISVAEGGGHMSAADGMYSMGVQAGPIAIIWSLVNLLPGLGVAIRRMHDVDRSGWWLFILLVPLVGAIVIIVWFCQAGTAGDNRFGPDPRRPATL